MVQIKAPADNLATHPLGRVTRRRDRHTPAAQRVIALQPITDAIRERHPELPSSSRYVAEITDSGAHVDVLSVSVDLDGLPLLREHAIQASLAMGCAYFETGVRCDYCGRLCPPDVAYDHARWLRNNEGTWVA